MFPNVSQLKIRTIWRKTRFNVQEAMDLLLEEESANNQLSSSRSESTISNDDNCSKSSKSSSVKIKRKAEGKYNLYFEKNIIGSVV